MHSGICASIASSTAALVPEAGTNTTDTSALVAAIVSATVPKTGTDAPFSSIVCPAFLGLVPPTTVVPAASIRAPCLRPSEPVMPAIITRLSAVRKIATSCSLRCGQFGRAARRAVHRVYLLQHRQVRFLEDGPALGRLVAVQPDDNRPAGVFTARGQHAERGHDPVGHRVAG